MNAFRPIPTPRNNTYTACAHRDTALMTPPLTPPKRNREHKHEVHAGRARNKEKRKKSARKVKKLWQTQSKQSSDAQRHEQEESLRVLERALSDSKRHKEVKIRAKMDKRRKCSESNHANNQAKKQCISVMNKDPPAIPSAATARKGQFTSPPLRSYTLSGYANLYLTRSKHDDEPPQVFHRPHRERPVITTDSKYNQVKIRGRKIGEQKTLVSCSAQSHSATNNDQDDEDSEEEHETVLYRMTMSQLKRRTCQYGHVEIVGLQELQSSSTVIHEYDNRYDTMETKHHSRYNSPEHCKGLEAVSAVNVAFEFMQGLQHEQYELDAKCHRIEAEIKKTRHKVFRLEAMDYWRIEELLKLLNLSLCLCQELFVVEYAFRDLLDEHSADVGFDFSGALAKLQGTCRTLINNYDGEILRYE